MLLAIVQLLEGHEARDQRPELHHLLVAPGSGLGAVPHHSYGVLKSVKTDNMWGDVRGDG